MIRITINYKIRFFISFILFAFMTSVDAFTLASSPLEKAWHPVFSIGAGALFPDGNFMQHYFPIRNTVTDEFYNYSCGEVETSELFAVFLGAEGNIYRNFWLQAGVGYNQTSPFSFDGCYLQGADCASANNYNYHFDVLIRQLLLQGKLFYALEEGFYPYVFAGIGTSFNKAYNYYTNAPRFLTFTRNYADNTETSFSYAVGFGLDLALNCYLRAGIGYRYADLGEIKLGQAVIDTTKVQGTLSQLHTYTHQVIGELTWVLG